MSTGSGHAWREISPYLDEALELEAEAREQWLGELEARAPDLASRLKALLAEREQLEARNFLGGAPPVHLHERSVAGLALGAYTLVSPLGHGGMGTVWLAERNDGRFEGRAAVKLLRAALVGRPSEQRFVREGSVLARLQHPHIAHLIDAGIAPGGQRYLVLEYVEGTRIDRYCEERGLSLEQRVRLFLDVLAAVAHAHSHLVVHRDLKPSNILVTDAGVVKLLDFGVAALLAPGDGPSTDMTREADLGLTPEYAAPEQLLGHAVTTATDVYALGLVLFVLLAGRHPAEPEGKSAAELMRLTLDHEPPRPSHLAPDSQWARLLRGDLDNIVAKALKKDPEERYATAEAFAQDLRRFLAQEPVSAHADSFSYRAAKFVRRHRGSVAGAAITAVALVGMASFAFVQMLEARRQRDEAHAQTQQAEGFSALITSLLSQVGPGGRALTPEELLERATTEVRQQYASDPPTLVSMLIRISGRYYDLRKTDREYATLVEAEAIAKRHGDPVKIIDVQCNTVETELALDRPREARLRMAEASRLLRSLAEPDARLQADCLRAQAELAKAEGDIPAALAHLARARRLLEAEGRTWGNVYPGIVSMLAGYNSLAGNYREAHRHWVELEAIDRRYGRQGSVAALLSRAALAHSFYSVGQVRRARELSSDATPARDPSGAVTPLNPSAAYRYGEILSRMGEHERALQLIRGAVATSDESGVRRLQIQSRLSLARALLPTGALTESEKVLDEVDTLLREAGPFDPGWRSDALRTRAELRLAQQRSDAAMQELATALRELGYPANHTSPFLARVLATRARVELARGQPAAAIGSASTAAELFARQSLEGAESADIGETLLVLARAQAAAGDRPAARAAAVRAQRILSETLGPEHAVTGEAARLARTIPKPPAAAR